MPLEYDKYISKIESAHIIAYLRIDGIIHVYIKENTTINVSVLDSINDCIQKLTDVPRQFIFQAGHGTNITNKARKRSAKLQEIYPSISTAVIVEGAKQRMIANIFYALVKLNSPIKSFKTLEQCLIWSNEVLNSGSVNKNKVLL